MSGWVGDGGYTSVPFPTGRGTEPCTSVTINEHKENNSPPAKETTRTNIMQHSDSITKTRTTRMIYVEEISDTEISERRNSSFKSYESEVSVGEIMKTSSSKVSPRASPGKKAPPQTEKGGGSNQKPISPGLNLKSPMDVSNMKKDIPSPSHSSTPSKDVDTEHKDQGKNELNKVDDEGLNGLIDGKESEIGQIEDGSQNEGVKATTTIIDMDDDTPKQNGEVLLPLEKEAQVRSEATILSDIKEMGEQANTDGKKGENGGVQNHTDSSAPEVTQQSKAVDNVEKTPVSEDTVPPILPKRKFSKNFSSASVVSDMSGHALKAWSDTEGSEPPSRKGTRKNLLLSVKSKRAFQLEEEKTIVDSLLYDTFRPLLFCMKVSGIFFVRKKGQFGKTFREVVRSSTALQIYCLSMCGLLFLNFLRSMLAFDPNDGFSNVLFLKFLTAIFMYESSSRAALAYWHASRKNKGLQDLFLSVEKICYPDSIIPYEGHLRGVMRAAIVLSIMISLANMGCNAYGVFGPASQQFDSYLVPAPPDSPGIEAMKVFVLILVLINGTVAMLSLSFFTVICYVLYKEFEYLCRTFVMKIRTDGSFNDDLEKFRLTHQKRCKLVEDADSMFKFYIANTYMTNVPLLCILLYVIVYAEGSDLSYTVVNAFRLFYVLVQMVVVSVAATIINNQAHAPLADIYSIKVQSTTSERQLEVNMFLNKLTGTSIGLTAWDMFVINKPTVLTVVGMVLTYFFLLVQFKNPLGEPTKCECMVNVTSSVLRSLTNLDTSEAVTEAVSKAVTEVLIHSSTTD